MNSELREELAAWQSLSAEVWNQLPYDESKNATMKTSKNLCPITQSATNRDEANQLTATIQDNFPRGIGQPALRALASAGYQNLEQLANVSESDLLKLHGMGPKALRILREALAANGLAFRA